MLPFQPQPIDVLKRRYPKAIERVWVAAPHMADTPSKHRENVFDFESGLRLIISKDVLGPEQPEIHLSASWKYNPPTTLDAMHSIVREAFISIGNNGMLHWIGFSQGGIPHWYIEYVN